MDKVLFRRDGRIGRITLNRPDVMNAIDDEVPEPKTKRVRGRVEFTVRVGAAECSGGEESVE